MNISGVEGFKGVERVLLPRFGLNLEWSFGSWNELLLETTSLDEDLAKLLNAVER